jgi:hypothetical protein
VKTVTKDEAIEYLTKDGPGLRVPCSRYGRTSAECAPVAYHAAMIVARECGDEVIEQDLDYAMYCVVNNLDDIQNLFDEYGKPTEVI